MKCILLLIALAGVCQTPPAFSSDAPADGAGRFYFTADAGAVWLENVGFRNSAGSGTFRFDPGFRLDVAGGYQFTPSLSVEVETGLTINRVRTFTSDFSEEDSVYLLQVPLLANVTCRIPTRSPLKPFLGAGVGGVHTSLENWSLFSDEFNGEDFTFGFQGFAGLRWQISEKTELGLAYKFLGTTDHSLEHMEGTRSHSAVISFAIRF